MQQNTQQLSQAFLNENNHAYLRGIVSHTPEAIVNFANLAARVVEIENQAHLTMHRLRSQHLVRARLWSRHPIIGHHSGGHPDKGSQQDIFVGEVFLRPCEDGSDICNPEGLLCSLKDRKVQVSSNNSFHTEGWYGGGVRLCKLSIIPTQEDTSRLASIVCEALRDGIAINDGKRRPARIIFEQYTAGQGRTGSTRQQGCPTEFGYLLEKDNDIFIVSTEGTFLLDDENRIRGALNIPHDACYDCYGGMHYDIDERLDVILQGRDLTGKRAFLIASCNGGKNDTYLPGNCGEITHKARQALERKGAIVYAPAKEAEGLI